MNVLGATSVSTLEAVGIIVGIIVGIVSGVSGLVLGLLNLWHQRVTTRPRIVVRPRIYSLARDDTGELIAKNAALMEIRNVGQIPVVGSTIGFLPRWHRIQTVIRFLPKCVAKLMQGHEKNQGSIIPKPKPVSGRTWMREIKPQDVAILQFSLEGLGDTKMLGPAFASTIVGDTFKASRRDMRIFSEQRKALSPSLPAKHLQ